MSTQKLPLDHPSIKDTGKRKFIGGYSYGARGLSPKYYNTNEMSCSLCHAHCQFRSFVALASLPISNRPIYQYSDANVSSLSHICLSFITPVRPVAYSLLNSAIQTIYILAYKPCELMLNYVKCGQQML